MTFLSFNLALNVIGLVTDTKTVAIYKDTKEVLAGKFLLASSIMSCNVIDDSKLCEHPIESGAMVTDHKFFNPVEIDIRLSLPNYIYRSVYKELRQIYEESPKLRIKTKAGWYSDMVLQALPHEEKPENFDRIIFDLHFKEVKEVEPKYIKLPTKQLKNAENSTTKKVGDNATNSNKRVSILKQGKNAVQGAIGGLF